jgi:chemotaxis protein CheD
MNPDNRKDSHDLDSNRIPEPRERSKFYLHPGQLFVSSEGHEVTTILGSCVAVCLWDSVAKIGGINHFLLPAFSGEGIASTRFGDVATKELIRQLLARGGRRHMLEAKIFGGACVVDAFQFRQNHLGESNARTAEDLLRAAGIPSSAQDVGGRRGRKLIFHTDTGAAWIKVL